MRVDCTRKNPYEIAKNTKNPYFKRRPNAPAHSVKIKKQNLYPVKEKKSKK